MDTNGTYLETRSEDNKNLEKAQDKIRCFKELASAFKNGKQQPVLRATIQLLTAISEATSDQPEELDQAGEALSSSSINFEESEDIEADTASNVKAFILKYEGRISDLELKLREISNDLTSANQQVVDLRMQLEEEQLYRSMEQACYAVLLSELQRNLCYYMIANYSLNHKVVYLNKQIEVMRTKIKDHDRENDQLLTPTTVAKQEAELKKKLNNENEARGNIKADERQQKLQNLENRMLGLETRISQITEKFKNTENLKRNDLQTLHILVDRLDIKTFVNAQPPEDQFEDEFVNIESDQEGLKQKDKKLCNCDCQSTTRSPSYEDAVRGNHTELTKNLNCDVVFISPFIQNKIFTQAECDEILQAGTSAEVNYAFLRRVQTRGKEGFDTFYSTLVSTNQHDLADKLMPHLSPSKNSSIRMVQEQGYSMSDDSLSKRREDDDPL